MLRSAQWPFFRDQKPSQFTFTCASAKGATASGRHHMSSNPFSRFFYIDGKSARLKGLHHMWKALKSHVTRSFLCRSSLCFVAVSTSNVASCGRKESERSLGPWLLRQLGQGRLSRPKGLRSLAPLKSLASEPEIDLNRLKLIMKSYETQLQVSFSKLNTT